MTLIWKPTILILTLLLLSGCATKFAAGLEAANREITGMIENIKAMNDITANGYKQAPCLIDVGAYHRVLSPDEQRAVDLLCGGSGEKPVTVEDVKRFRELMDMVEPK